MVEDKVTSPRKFIPVAVPSEVGEANAKAGGVFTRRVRYGVVSNLILGF